MLSNIYTPKTSCIEIWRWRIYWWMLISISKSMILDFKRQPPNRLMAKSCVEHSSTHLPIRLQKHENGAMQVMTARKLIFSIWEPSCLVSRWELTLFLIRLETKPKAQKSFFGRLKMSLQRSTTGSAIRIMIAISLHPTSKISCYGWCASILRSVLQSTKSVPIPTLTGLFQLLKLSSLRAGIEKALWTGLQTTSNRRKRKGLKRNTRSLEEGLIEPSKVRA